jgi:hypothetical protein
VGEGGERGRKRVIEGQGCASRLIKAFAQASNRHTPLQHQYHQAGHDAPWVLYRLEDNQDVNANINERREEYVPVRVSESEIEVR